MAGRGVKTWRHLPTWCQRARWRRRTWRQNVASFAHAASGSQVGFAGRGVKMWRHWFTWHQGARWRGRTWLQNVARWRRYVTSGSQVASKCGVTCLRGVREPRAVAGALPALARVALLGVAERGVKMWRHLPTWRQGATWRRRTWRQNVASGAIDLRGVTGRGVKTWRHEARPPGTCLQNVSPVFGRYVHPHRRPPCKNRLFKHHTFCRLSQT